MRKNLGIKLFIVLTIIGWADRARAQYLEWTRWHTVATGRVRDQVGNPMDQFTMTSVLNLDNGMCVLVLRDTSTGHLAMIEAPGTGNCNE